MDANNLKYSKDYVDAQQAEIERLRRYEQGYEQCRVTLKNVADDRNEMQGMIKRLRDEVDTLKARIEFQTSCITVYRDEAMLGWEKAREYRSALVEAAYNDRTMAAMHHEIKLLEGLVAAMAPQLPASSATWPLYYQAKAKGLFKTTTEQTDG